MLCRYLLFKKVFPGILQVIVSNGMLLVSSRQLWQGKAEEANQLKALSKWESQHQALMKERAELAFRKQLLLTELQSWTRLHRISL